MKSIDTGLQILALFKDASRPLGVVEIADQLGLGKSHASRILATMRDLDFLQQDTETRKYRVGIEAFAVGSRFLSDQPMTRLALPIMRACSDATQHSVFLSIRHGTSCRHILAVEGRHFEDTQWRLGVRLPLHASASGKIFVALAEDADRQALLEGIPLKKYTADTITDRAFFWSALEKVRNDMWATARGETVAGLGACAVPVVGAREVLVAAFGVVSPLRHLPHDVYPLVNELSRHAQQLSYQLGARVYPEIGSAG